MKIRKGFVSNSSSSSFCIYGISIEQEEIAKKMVELGFIEKDGDDYNDIFEWLYGDSNKILEQNGLSVNCPYDDDICIGREWKSIKDNETGKEFKESVEKSLNKMFKKDIKCSTIEVAWYDG
ncbi:MAG TPA: hypothetical protein VMZ91_12670 [Candidatus Paceibacterota bacterium]|nr:hypothetical protein [Candidatus Paceibacterota bacterium]